VISYQYATVDTHTLPEKFVIGFFEHRSVYLLFKENFCPILRPVASQFENPKNKKECHASESWHSDQMAWIPAFAGMTLKMKLRHYPPAIALESAI